MIEIELFRQKAAIRAPLITESPWSRSVIQVGDRVRWAFGRRWTVLAIDGDEAWLKSSDRCSTCKRTAPLSQLRFCSPLLEM